MSPPPQLLETRLDQRLERGPLSADETARLVWALCEWFDREGGREVLGDVSPDRVTLVGRTVVARTSPDAPPVPGFSAPERANGPATPRTDVYAMGALMYRSVVGRPPDGAPVPDAASHLRAIIERCLEVDPARRFNGLRDLARALVRLDKTLVSVPAGRTAAFSRTTLGPWKLDALIGQGSMGHVFKATHQALGRHAAIKVLRAEQYQDPDLIQRFFQEARTVNQINHEHIVEISDFVQEPGPSGPSAVYCVMEFLSGKTLGDVLETGPIALDRGLAILAQVAGALAAAHKVGVVHRDVKPDNIMLIERGGRPDYVKVLDFGVAKLIAADGTSMASTAEGAIIGTPICMSPEQAQGEEVDGRTDVWATGVILYRLLTGHYPFDAPTFVNIAVQIITRAYPPVPARAPLGEEIPPRLRALVEGCLEKDRDRRVPSMEKVRDELEALLAEEPSPRPLRITAPLPAARPRRWAWLAGVVAVLAVAAAVPLVLAPDPPPPVAVTARDGVLPVAVATGAGNAPAAVEPPATVEEDGGGPLAVAPDEVEPPPAVRPPPRARVVKLTRKMVAGQISGAQSAFRACAEASKASLAQGESRYPFAFSIARNGSITDVKALDRALSGSPFERCVARAVGRLRFPANDGDPSTANPRFYVEVRKL